LTNNDNMKAERSRVITGDLVGWKTGWSCRAGRRVDGDSNKSLTLASLTRQRCGRGKRRWILTRRDAADAISRP